jgi:hypothetical protein
MKIARDKDTWMIPSRRLLFFTMVWMSWFLISGTAPLWAADITVQNNVGVKVAPREAAGKYALGSVSLDGQIVETPLETGVLAFRNAETGQLVWLPASRAEQVSASKVLFSGSDTVDGATIQFKLTVEAPADLKAVKFTYDFSSDRDLPGWQAVLAYHSDFTHRWKCHIYPYAEDSRYVQRDPLSYMGIPSVLLYRDDRSLGVFWGLDMNWDYLDPTNWTKDIGLYFIDGVVAPQFRVGGASLKANFQYEAPMQLVMTANPDPDGMITELMRNWIRLNRYWPEPLQVRSNDQALNYFIEGRKKTSLWNPGKGYRLEYGDVHTSFIYIGEQGLNAYFDYLIYELTGDPLWRTRAFEQMDFIAKGQNTNPDDPNYGVVQTAYNLSQESPGGLGFNSLDRGTNPGYKPDLNAHLPRYMLLTWKRVKDHEGTDRQDWYKTAKLAMDWVMRQQNVDGGLAQKIELRRYDTLPDHDWMDTGYPDRVKTKVGEKSPSAASGRALPATWSIYKLTSDPKYRRFMDSLEQYTLDHVQNQYYYTGHHPDLPPIDFEEASIWGIAEYWLNRYDETHDRKYVDHAVADAYLALTWWCPKQLSWVKNPTLGGSAEQQHFLQYSVYSYQDRKPETIQRLYQATGDPLWGALAQRVFQNIYFTEITEGDFVGATHERIADPWLARKDDPGPAEFNSMGTIYMAEQSLDAFLQVVEMYRTGRDLYFGGGITNRVYPDGVTYYSEDIGDRKKANLSVLPSSGTITVKVDTWTGEQKKWTVNDPSGQEITTLHKVGDLKPHTRYRVLENSRPLGTFLSDAKGTIQFSQTVGYKASRSYEVESR